MINLSRPILPVEDNLLDFNFVLYVSRQYWLPRRECREVRSVVILLGLMPCLWAMKAQAALRRIPTIVLIMLEENRDFQVAYDLSVNSHIVKPTGFDNFMDAARQIVPRGCIFNKLKGGSCDASSIYR